MAEMIGEVIGNYRIEELIGSGGMGRVYRAVHLLLGRPAAVKIMHDHLAADPAFQERFRQEARASAALHHPNIILIHDFGEQAGRLFLVLELVTEGSLRTLIRKQHASGELLPLVVGLDIMRQASDGLAYAHAHGMFHRDIKPDNLLLSVSTDPEQVSPYAVKVCDFGLARLAEGGVTTAAGALLGTPAYMSPEQCLGIEVDARTDIYSLGLVLYEVTTGRLPFDTKTPTEAAYKHIHVAPPPVRSIRPDLPPQLETLIDRCLAKSPADRFQHAGDVSAALIEVIRFASTSAAGWRSTPPSHGSPQLERQFELIARPITGPLTPATATLQLFLEQESLVISPGRAASLPVRVRNLTDRPVEAVVAVEGVDPSWITVIPPVVSVAEHSESSAIIWIDVPVSGNYRTGEHPVSIGVGTIADATQLATARARWRILPTGPPMSISPTLATGRSTATFRVRVRNDADAERTFALAAESPARAASIVVSPESLDLVGGATGEASISIGHRPRRIGTRRAIPLTVQAQSDDGRTRQQASATFGQEPTIPLWSIAPIVLILAIVVGLIAWRSQESPASADDGQVPRIVGVTLDPAIPVSGQPLTVHWQVEGAETVDIRPLASSLDASAGSQVFPDGIAVGTALILVAKNAAGSAEHPIEYLSDGVASPTAIAEPTPTPAPRIRPTPSPTATARPAPAPPAQGEIVIISSMFDWASDANARGSWSFESGTYHIRVESPEPWSLFEQTDETNYTDLFASVSVRGVEWTDTSRVCLHVRSDPTRTGRFSYALCLDGDGRRASGSFLQINQDGSVTIESLLEVEDRGAPWVIADWNTLTIAMRGDRLWYFVNGELLGSAEHEGPEHGAIAISVGSDGSQPVEFEFRDLSIHHLAN